MVVFGVCPVDPKNLLKQASIDQSFIVLSGWHSEYLNGLRLARAFAKLYGHLIPL